MKIRITESQLKKCVSTSLKEQAFNDDGEPLMTHSQYRDYSEPSEDDNDYNWRYEPEYSEIDLLKKYLKDRDIMLESYGEKEYFIRTRNNTDFMIYPMSDYIEIYIIGEEGEREKIKVSDAVMAIRFILKHKDELLTFDESAREIDREYRIEARDKQNNRYERGLGEGKLTEQGFGDYLAGADYDSNAPWNQEDEPDAELEDIDIIDDNVSEFNEVYVLYTNESGGEAEVTLEDILKGINVGEAQMNYFNDAIKQYPRPVDFEKRVLFIAKIYDNLHSLDYHGGKEYEASDEWDNADDYRDEM